MEDDFWMEDLLEDKIGRFFAKVMSAGISLYKTNRINKQFFAIPLYSPNTKLHHI